MTLMVFKYETPVIEVLGQLDELTGSDTGNHDDGDTYQS